MVFIYRVSDILHFTSSSQHQRLNRDSAMWQDTLRQRQPYLDGMKGLRRLTLNSNPALGDQGAAAIAEVLTEDLWIKGELRRDEIDI